MQSSKYEVRENEKHGYLEIHPKPTDAELQDYYASKYFADSKDKKNQYQKKYSSVELKYIQQKINEKYYLVLENIENELSSFFDFGCGEGHILKYFQDLGLEIMGSDYSSDGIQNHHPEILDYFMQGSAQEVITELVSEGKSFDLIWLDNVLEHATDPEGLLKTLGQIATKNSYLVLEVPCDFSKFQNYLKENSLIKSEYWVAPPDHLAYFTPKSLTSLCNSSGWNVMDLIGDFPIELYLLNDYSNYSKNKDVGKEAHQSRMRFTDFLHSNNSPKQILDFYRSSINANVGRQITCICKYEA
jgi:2-polyprenyl-3-methyl-5-hydroxy-6-metoxy-1,4-benzoquinol methylase